MPEHVADGRDIHSGLEQRHRSAVPHAVRVESLLCQRWRVFGGSIQASGENVTNSEPAQRLTSVIDKDVGFWRKLDLPLLAERPQHCRGFRPEWTVSFFFPFAEESHLKRPAQLKVSNPQIDDFLDAPARVEHNRQESVVPNALRCRSVDRFQNRIDLFVFQVVDCPVRGALEWNCDRPLRKIS